ncbi:MAG: deoxyribodipyrimidine photo-lyase [Rhizobiaceae bacterium]|nr:deoxyribodipyrimidine photo-lyase [Rhizobiaceae bacterium]
MIAKIDRDEAPVIVLFRRDLRLADNRALAAAADTGRPVVAVFVDDRTENEGRKPGRASDWWLHHSLAALSAALADLGAPLVLRRGAMAAQAMDLVAATGARAVYWNRRYDPPATRADTVLKDTLRGAGLEATSFDGALLHEPSLLKTSTGTSYRVYTPFQRAVAAAGEPRDPVDAPGRLKEYRGRIESLSLQSLDLLPRRPDWAGGLRDTWVPGETGAWQRLAGFLDHRIDFYEAGRDMPDGESTSRLSPHLAFGEITPYQILAALNRHRGANPRSGADKFRKEIAWREFCNHLLFHKPDLHEANFNDRFDRLAWRSDGPSLKAWQHGRTGYPIVDAGMRQLWQTGWMHNRVRMIAASFLSKHLLIDWRDGESWFWDTLVDADPASNPANWQWVAGSGADAAPYFRIFNPILQGEKFDGDGGYVRRFVPELAKLPNRWLHKPWLAPQGELERAGVVLGETYPHPLVDHDRARARALAAFDAVRNGG